MRRILVTGGAGFIGANFCHYWTTTHPQDRVVVLDALTHTGNRSSIGPLIAAQQLRFVHGDIIDLDQVTALLVEERIDTVVNLAAESHVDRSIEQPHVFLRTNVMGTHALLEATRRAWTSSASGDHRFHHVSTDEVYGSREENEAPSKEGSPYAPNSPYAASKAAADHLVRAYTRTYGLPSSISHCSNNYGPYQFPEKLLPLCLLNILEGRTLPIYGDGLQLRNWIHVHDHCRAIDAILNNSPPGEVWNIGSSSSECNLTMVTRLCDYVDQEFAANPELARRFPQSAPARGQESRQLIVHVPDRPGHDRRYAIDCSKLSKRLGFLAATDLLKGLAATASWYLSNEPWWRPLRNAGAPREAHAE